MPIRTLTSANAVILLSQPDILPAPFQLQGFSADDVFGVDDVDIAETSMGVDGHLSGGYTPQPINQNYTLQADSLSVDNFEAIYGQMVQQKTIFYFSGTTRLLSVNKSYAMRNGLLVRFKPMPDAKKTLQPRTFGIRWESVTAALIN